MRDNRYFRRYLRGSDFSLRLSKGPFNAKVLDYSLSGIGALIEDSPPIKKGDILALAVQGPRMRSDGEVVWTRPGKDGLRLGLRNIGLPKCSIGDYRLPDALVGLQRSRRTGILTVQSDNFLKKIYVRNGDMVFAVSNQEEDRLGDMLLKEGRITPEQHDRSVAELERTKERQGSVLVRLGYLKPQELAAVVKHQVEEIILGLIGLDYGEFAFEEMPLPTEEVITLKLSTANLIYNGIKRINNLRSLESEVPPMDKVVHFSPDPLSLFQDIRLDHSGRKIVSCVDGKTSLKDIISIAQLQGPEAIKTIYALLSIRMIEEETPQSPFVEMPEEVIEEMIGKKTEQESMPEMPDETRKLIDDMHQRYARLSYYGILGVKEHAALGEVKLAYYKAAKQFHPDVHFPFTDDSLRNKLSDIFSYVYEAYATLRDTEKRKEYDRMMTLTPARLTSNQDKAKALFEEGKMEMRKKKYPEAELLFGQAKYFDGTIGDYHYYYALALMKQDKAEEAEKSLERALKLEPHNANYIAELGIVFLALGFPTRARAFFEKALMISPDNVRAAEGISKIKSS
ncbi:MAG TPA: DUF4388 domain-containing protein [Thermodesulfovibrionales bacterium]|nr:DUF4388 domain-containing protein [Thermodesulfovibrionales bacterium]